MKKGFTLIELLAVIAVLAIILLIAVPNIINVIGDVKTNAYIKNVSMVTKASENYLAANPLLMPSNIGDTILVRLSDLKTANYITTIKDPNNSNNECSGYVMVSRISASKLDYTPHLNCNNNVNSPIEDSLILHYKFDDFQEPTDNFTPNGSFAGGLKVTSESGSYGNNVIIPFNSPIQTGYVLRQGPGVGTYVVHFKSGSPIKPSTTYTMSCWAGYTLDYDGNQGIFHHRVWDGTGMPTSNGLEAGALLETAVIDDITWQRRMFSFTSPSTVNGSFDWYIGYPTQNTLGARYITGIQLEEKTYPTPWVDNIRTSTVKDYSGNNRNSGLLLATTPKWVDSNTARKAAYQFDGINDYIISSSSINISGSQTISAWINPSNISGLIGIAGFHEHTTTSNLGLNILDGYLSASIGYTDGTREYSDKKTTIPIVANQWTHVSLVYDLATNTIKFYINGKFNVQHSLTKTVKSSSLPLFIGQWAQSHLNNYMFNGLIDDVRIYNRNLSDNEIKQIYNS